MAYVDGYVIPIPRKSLTANRKMAAAAEKVWREHGAVDYKECAGDDLKVKFGMPFIKLARVKPRETVAFSWIRYKSRKHRDAVNVKVMKDPCIARMIISTPPFDVKRMAFGGF